nr:MAG TPA: hypothetical protein [Caudoviricetes sp.]DAW73120.1 MAG TPA: hypothetical protein [Caudoviricetes sp.]
MRAGAVKCWPSCFLPPSFDFADKMLSPSPL